MEELIEMLKNINEEGAQIWSCTITVKCDSDVYVIGGYEGNLYCEHLY